MLLFGSQLQLSVQQCLKAAALHQLLDQENHLHVRQDTGTCQTPLKLPLAPNSIALKCHDVRMSDSAQEAQPSSQIRRNKLQLRV